MFDGGVFGFEVFYFVSLWFGDSKLVCLVRVSLPPLENISSIFFFLLKDTKGLFVNSSYYGSIPNYEKLWWG